MKIRSFFTVVIMLMLVTITGCGEKETDSVETTTIHKETENDLENPDARRLNNAFDLKEVVSFLELDMEQVLVLKKEKHHLAFASTAEYEIICSYVEKFEEANFQLESVSDGTVVGSFLLESEKHSILITHFNNEWIKENQNSRNDIDLDRISTENVLIEITENGIDE